MSPPAAAEKPPAGPGPAPRRALAFDIRPWPASAADVVPFDGRGASRRDAGYARAAAPLPVLSPAAAAPAPSTAAEVTMLHAAYGNGAMARAAAGALPGPAGAIQRKAGSAASPALPAASQIAGRGVASAGSDLPHKEAIQKSFGRYDVGTTRTQIGGAGATASAALGAKSYAHGGRIAFSGAPDLHTAAHEAAHIVQQRAGRAPAGGLDTPGEPLEGHADAVADAVVAGRSAEGLLDAAGGLGEAGAVTAVQRKPESAPPPATTTNPDYVNRYRAGIVAAVADRIAKTGLPQPHPRVHWASLAEAAQALGAAIWDYVAAVPDMALKRLMMLSYPANLFALVDAARRGPEGSRLEAVEIVVATAFDQPITASVLRMGTRLCVQMDLHGGARPPATDLVASSPLDGVVGGILLKPGLVFHQAARKGAPDDTGGRPFARGLREVRYEWQGARDPALWNWIRVTAPPDATAEDVAHTPLAGGEVVDGSEQAYRIVASPPYFGIPFETARLVPEAVAHAPPALRAKPATGPGPRVADPGVLGRSIVGDEAALIQAPRPARADPPLDQSLARVEAQLEFMRRELGPKAGALAGAVGFVERRRGEFGRDRKSAEHWTPALAAQERILHAAASELAAVLDEAAAGKATGLDPVKRLVAAYALAGGVSHIHAEAVAALAEARRLRALLPLAIAEDRVLAARSAVAEQRKAEAGSAVLEPYAAQQPVNLLGEMQAAADLRLKAVRGEKLDPDAVEQLAVEASETELRAYLVTLATQAHAVMRRADEVGVPQGRYPSGAWSVHMVADEILKRVGRWQDELDRARHWSGPVAGLSPAQTMQKRLRDAVGRVAQDQSRFRETLDFPKPNWFEFAGKVIADKELNNLLTSLALQLGVAIVTGQAIGAAGALLRGLALAAEVGGELRGAGLLYKGAEILVEAGVNTGVQGALGGQAGAGEFAENALTSVFAGAVLRPFRGLLEGAEVGEVEAEIRSWRDLARRGGRLAAATVVETGGGIGAASIAHAVTHGGEFGAPGGDDLIIQGISVAVGRFVRRQTKEMQKRIEEAGRKLRTGSFDKLLARVSALQERAAAAKAPRPEEALAELAERHALLVEEKKLYGDDPNARVSLAATEREQAATGAQFADVPLRLAQLSPVVEGRVYEGTAAQIEHAYRAAQAAGVPMKWVPVEHGWRVVAGDRTIEVRERGHGERIGAGEQAPPAEKPAAGGHHLELQPDGVHRCSDEPCPLLRVVYAAVFSANEALRQQMDYIDRIRPTEPERAKKLADGLQGRLEAEQTRMRMMGDLPAHVTRAQRREITDLIADAGELGIALTPEQYADMSRRFAATGDSAGMEQVLAGLRRGLGKGRGVMSEQLERGKERVTHPQGRDPTDVIRAQPGTPHGGEELPPITENWFLPRQGGAEGQRDYGILLMPGQIAARLRRIPFRNFDDFRRTFWQMVSQYPRLAREFDYDPNNLARMASGRAPRVPGQTLAGRKEWKPGLSNLVYQIDHKQALENVGFQGLYDLSNMEIKTKYVHDFTGE